MPLARPNGVLISYVVLKSPRSAHGASCAIGISCRWKITSEVCDLRFVSFLNAEFPFWHNPAHRPAPDPVTSGLIS